MWFNQLKTTFLLASLAGILMLIGGFIGGYSGIFIAFIIALGINGFAYFYSAKLVLNMYKAKPLNQQEYSNIYKIVKDLTSKNSLPMPKLWLINTPMANAFATGRNPKHASVAVTTGILDILTEEELTGVLAHEISHIKNRDILISTIAAVIATAISFLANMAQNFAFWGTMTRNQNQNNKGPNPIALLLIAILTPIAATLIRLAISRSREYLADESGAELSHDPLALASALEKLQTHIAYDHLKDNDTLHAATSHLFIVYPFSGKGFSALFSTHPPMQKRVTKLRKMHDEMIQDKKN